MTTLSASFNQSPSETKRYLLDYTLFLSVGEQVDSFEVTVIQTGGPTTGPALVVTDLTLLPANSAGLVLGAVYYISGGNDGCVYEVQFLCTTSVGQILEDVIQYVLAEKT
jgi:hypothetical protein